MALSRHLCREIVFQVLFSWEFEEKKLQDASIGQKLQEHIQEFQKGESSAFLEDLLHGIVKHITTIQDVIRQYAPEWPLEKINPIDRSILYLGVYEILFDPDVPDIVAIDEAIETAKKYGNENSSKFVNGVLNTVMKNKDLILASYV
jgi:N utilization substance protein B